MDESLFSQYCWIADVTGFYINILFGHILSYVLGILHLHVLDSLDSWKYHFQKDLNIIDSSNLNYKIAVVNMTVYLWAILGIIHLWCPHKGCTWGLDLAEEKAKLRPDADTLKGGRGKLKVACVDVHIPKNNADIHFRASSNSETCSKLYTKIAYEGKF